ncbi:MAG TPA: hypothetical protein VEY09_04965 [Pyrinomonadaceae bacterium]|nr:hypothetical protein [Pyrinomonadaceae bacterium]
MKRINSLLMTAALLFAASFAAVAAPAGEKKSAQGARGAESVRVPLDLAVLIQDDLVARVGNELKVTSEFIRSLPGGSRVMVGYIRGGSLQVRQPFTEDLAAAAGSLRMPVASTSVSPYNPYVDVVSALKKFPADGRNRNALLLVSDGLDTSRGFDAASALTSIDLERAVREAKERNVQVYSFYAPSVGLTSYSRQAVSLGQGALNRLSEKTGGRAFFQGTSFVTFNAYFERLREALNERGGVAY